MIKIHNWHLIFICLIWSSCSTSRLLPEGQFYITKNKIILNSSEKIENRSELIQDLKSLYKQTPVSRKFWNPRHWFSDRQLEILDEELTKETALLMEKFLKNKKGFYNANVRYLLRTNRNEIEVQYVIEAGQRYYVQSLEYIGNDAEVLELIREHKDESFINPGDPLDAAEFDREKSRITSLLQNNGYANFVSNYINLRGDSLNYQVDVFIEILPSVQDSVHQKYSIGDVNVYTEHLITPQPSFQKVDTFDNQYYYSKSDEYIVRPNTLNRSIFLKKGELFQKEERLKTIRSLSNLSTYRYVYVNPRIDSLQDSIINFDIFLTPHQKKWIIDLGSDLFYSTVSQIGRKLFGISGNASIQNRNFFGGSELYKLDLESTVEFNLEGFKDSQVSFRAENVLELPRQVDFFGFAKILRTLKILNEKGYQDFQELTTTDIRLGYNYTKIVDFYTLHSFNASWGYDYRPNARTRYLIRQLSLNLFNPINDSLFVERVLESNPLLEGSFVANLSTGFLFRDLSLYYQSTKTQSGSAMALLANFEMSGLEVWGLNKLRNVFSENNVEWELGSINFSKFMKTEIDLRFYKDMTRNSTFAARLNWGIAWPFGGDNVVPYPVQFFVGGPNSIRAWQLRELGPGGYSDLLLMPEEGQPFFQSGDIKLEFNLEYRWDLFWYLEGALFLDGGNVWTLDAEDARDEAEFGTDFLKHMALGFGYGIRLDFTYFLIRFDFGFKLRNPFPDPENNNSYFALNKRWNSYPFGNINVAVNYPF